jgi:putative nucleotidyltransferase with HDIG domain
MSRAGNAYLLAVILTGASVIAYSAWDLLHHPISGVWLVLLALTSFSSTFTVRIPNVSATISVSETFVFIAALVFGPPAAALTIAMDGLLISWWGGHRQPAKMLFNATQPALSIFIATHVFVWLAGVQLGPAAHVDLGRHLWPILAFTLTYFVLNSGLNALVVSFASGRRLWSVWWQPHFGWLLLNYLGAASVSALLLHNANFNPMALAIVVPLIVISYFTFQTAMQRVTDANQHLEKLNSLYLSIIEAMAMAVEAKDQVTHGHIRRVQTLAVGLARGLGITDPNEIQAIQAAAVLHDMGKLHVPEHILNKPGKLSAAEFETMKQHADKGADILAPIAFPYPVVPIVRHHHERWDGKGYPAGLSGIDIPVGARILSVVDCFDALTSDRPYRRALSVEQAMQMLVDGRGTAYDPDVVDTFARVYPEVVSKDPEHAAPAVVRRAAAPETTAVPVPAPPPARGAVEADAHVLPALELLHAFSAQAALPDLAEAIAQQALRETPAALFALFVHDTESGDLAVAHTSGVSAEWLRGLRLPIGERLSGWVAANRRTICNSDAALDLGAVDEPFEGELHSTLSVPIVTDDALVGVVSLYARDHQAFTDRHRRFLEQLVVALGHAVRGALEFEKVQRATLPGALPLSLPPADQARLAVPVEGGTHLAAVSLQLAGIGTEDQRQLRGQLLGRAAAALGRDLRSTDLVYRDGPCGLLAVLPQADARAGNVIAGRVRDTLVRALQAIEPPVTTEVQVATGVASFPEDGLLLDAVLDAARRRAVEGSREPRLRLVTDGSGTGLVPPPKRPRACGAA